MIQRQTATGPDKIRVSRKKGISFKTFRLILRETSLAIPKLDRLASSVPRTSTNMFGLTLDKTPSVELSETNTPTPKNSEW